jgi:hypothetical protein
MVDKSKFLVKMGNLPKIFLMINDISQHIDHAIWLPSDMAHPLPRIFNERMLERMGIPRGRTDGKLETGQDALDLLRKIFDRTPDARTLLIFPGRVQGMMWEDLVIGAWRAIAGRVSPEELEKTADSIQQILQRAGQVRAAIAEKAVSIDDSVVARTTAHFRALCDAREAASVIKGEVTPLPEAVIQALRKKVMLNMVTGGDEYIWQGKVAAECGVIEDAFDIAHLGESPEVLAASVRRQLCERGVTFARIGTL